MVSIQLDWSIFEELQYVPMKYLFTYVMYKYTTSYRLTEMTDGLSVIHELNARIIPTKKYLKYR